MKSNDSGKREERDIKRAQDSFSLLPPKERRKISLFLKDHFPEPFELFSIKQDGSLRQYFRVKQGHRTQVLLHWQDRERHKVESFLHFQDFFLKQKVSVPRLFHVSKDKSLFLMEDLTDLSLEKKAHSFGNRISALKPFYKEAVFQLINIHSSFFKKNQRGENVLDRSYKTLFKEVLDRNRFMKEIEFTCFHLIEKLLSLKFSKKDYDIIQKSFLHICQRLDQEEKRISHRDYHSRNLMIKEKKIRVIDFQDALLAPLPYDLASLLFDSYTPLNDVLREELVEDYLLNMKFQKKPNKEEFKRALYWQNLQRSFKASGSFASFYNLRQNVNYLKYIPLCFQSMEESLKCLGECKDLLSLIQNYDWNCLREEERSLEKENSLLRMKKNFKTQ